MSESSTYQQIRSHLAYLRLSAAAEALPGELDHARQEKLGHSEFLARLLEVEVTATRSDAEPASSASPACLLRTLETSTSVPSLRRQEADERARTLLLTHHPLPTIFESPHLRSLKFPTLSR